MNDYLAMKEKAENEFQRWLAFTYDNSEFRKQLLALYGNDEEIVDSFYDSLKFGTSGIRGIIGPGTNRINEYVIRRATQGLANYLNKNNDEQPSVVISYDNREGSEYFAHETATVLRGNGIRAYIFRELTPVSVLSYAIRYLKCTMGIMITASHNPKIYNGYKVYNSEGHQVVGEEPEAIMKEIELCDYFTGIRRRDDKGIQEVTLQVREAFIRDLVYSMPKADPELMNGLKTVYTPLYGTGNRYVKAAFRTVGYRNFTDVPIQTTPDPEFPTCPTPNPERILAYDEGFRVLEQENADIIIATDPDADRVGVALIHDGMRTLVTGNQLGILMLDYLCHMKPPKEGQLVFKSIATSPLVNLMAERYGFHVVNTLTGFKYIGAQIAALRKTNQLDDFYFAFEESNSFLCSPFVTEKDGISAALLIVEMASFHKAQGKDLIDRLEELYQELLPCYDKQRSYFFRGADGKIRMERIMDTFRGIEGGKLGNHDIADVIDYRRETGLPSANIIAFDFTDGSRLIIRPSGTESKLKVYSFECTSFNDVWKDVVKIIDVFNQ